MRIDVLTLFPEACEPFFSTSIVGRARTAGRVDIRCHPLRDFSRDPHRKVDDRPFGGGAGMVLTCQPVFDAVEAIEREGGPALRILLTPQGRRLDQALAAALAKQPRLLLIAGHYEGFDERIREGLSPLELSIGDYVLSGGEAAALVVVDAVVRLLSGVLGADNALDEESFAGGALEYPQYTRPREFRGMTVPEVLLGGDHGAIRRWRMNEARRRTEQRRPDLMGGGRPSDDPETRGSHAEQTD
jgi:tRNA (guanine37-N1)-methyltransferase